MSSDNDAQTLTREDVTAWEADILKKQLGAMPEIHDASVMLRRAVVQIDELRDTLKDRERRIDLEREIGDNWKERAEKAEAEVAEVESLCARHEEAAEAMIVKMRQRRSGA